MLIFFCFVIPVVRCEQCSTLMPCRLLNKCNLISLYEAHILSNVLNCISR